MKIGWCVLGVVLIGCGGSAFSTMQTTADDAGADDAGVDAIIGVAGDSASESSSIPPDSDAEAGFIAKDDAGAVDTGTGTSDAGSDHTTCTPVSKTFNYSDAEFCSSFPNTSSLSLNCSSIPGPCDCEETLSCACLLAHQQDPCSGGKVTSCAVTSPPYGIMITCDNDAGPKCGPATCSGCCDPGLHCLQMPSACGAAGAACGTCPACNALQTSCCKSGGVCGCESSTTGGSCM